MKPFSRIAAALAIAVVGGFNVAQAAQKNETRVVNTKDFKGVSVSSVIDLELTQGPRKVEVIAPARFQDAVIVKVDGSVLTIGLKHKTELNDAKVVVKVSNPVYNYIHGSGASEIDVMCDLTVNELTIDVSGASDFTAKNILATDLSLKGSGSSEISAKSLECNKLETILSGASEVEIEKIIAVGVNIQGSGACDVNVSDISATSLAISNSGACEFDLERVEVSDITAGLSGASDLKLAGKAGRVDVQASGACEVDITGLKCDNVHTGVSGVATIEQ